MLMVVPCSCQVFKANSAVLNSLLTLLNERLFDNGSGRRAAPLLTCVGASNELPESQELDALFDRFLLRKVVKQASETGEGGGGAIEEGRMEGGGRDGGRWEGRREGEVEEMLGAAPMHAATHSFVASPLQA
jgi:hypothetical protein